MKKFPSKIRKNSILEQTLKICLIMKKKILTKIAVKLKKICFNKNLMKNIITINFKKFMDKFLTTTQIQQVIQSTTAAKIKYQVNPKTKINF